MDEGVCGEGERMDEEPFLLILFIKVTTPMSTRSHFSGNEWEELFGLKSSGSKASLPLKGYTFNSTSMHAQIVCQTWCHVCPMTRDWRVTDKMTTTRTDDQLADGVLD